MTGPSPDLLLRIASLAVPSGRRSEWLDEWRGELHALRAARASGAMGLPGATRFVMGSIRHALWMRTEGWTVEGLLQDIRYSARVLARAPGFTLVAALTLALGIGANAAIFSLVNGLVLRAPSGVQEPGRLVQIGRSFEQDPKWDSFSWPAMRLIGEEARALSGVAAYSGEALVIGRGGEAERVFGQLVTGNYFELLGVTPHVGRLLQPEDDIEPGAHPVVVLSHELWTRRYGADASIVGRTIVIGGADWEVVGVAPERFAGVQSIGTRPQLYAPVVMNPFIGVDGLSGEWGWSWLSVVGRLADGASMEEARSSMDVVAQRLRAVDTVHEGIVVRVAEGVGLDPPDREQASRLSAILGLIVALVLLLTCTNVANLLLARASARQAEIGVRVALGAGRFRLLRQMVSETTLVALLAIAFAVPMVALVGDLLPRVFPYTLSVSLEADARVFGFLAAIGLGSGLLMSLGAGWVTLREDAARTRRDGSSAGRRSRTRLRDGLVVAQLALSLGLVAGAALLGRSVVNAHRADPGFESAGLSAAVVGLYATGRYERESGQDFYRAMLDAGERLPGVRSVTLATQIPLAGGQSRASVQPVDREDVTFEAEFNVVGPHYFETLGIPILQGRSLGGFHDEPERVVVVNEALAERFWPGESPIGRELRGDPTWRVVGLVPDVQSRSLRQSGNPAVYYPIAHQYMPYSMALVVSSDTPEARSAGVLRDAITPLDPELPAARVVDVQASVVGSMGETRTIGYLVTAFAVLALVLAAVGLYGLVSYGASQRVREFGIRVAMGARPESLARLVLSRGLRIGLLGVVLGGGVTFGLGRALESLLFGVSAVDPVTFAGAAILLLGATAAAAWIPARRAGRVDAAVSLRERA